MIFSIDFEDILCEKYTILQSNCNGKFEAGNKTFHCHHRLGHGNVDLSTAIQQSCNVYFWDIALKIWRTYEGNPNESILQEYAKNLGFGELTGVDLPYQKKIKKKDRQLFEDWRITNPELVRPEGWLGGDLMNLIVGQGAITTTPLQVANAYKTLLTGYFSNPVSYTHRRCRRRLRCRSRWSPYH